MLGATPRGFGFPGTAEFPREAWLPRLTGQLHIGIIFGLIVAALIWFILNRTTFGYEIRVQGKRPLSARYAGINVMRNMMLVMFLSGGIAGLAGNGARSQASATACKMGWQSVMALRP